MTDNIARVVIACDPVGENRASIEIAARLAAWLDAALHGVFVEDETLLHLAAMPFARHVSSGGERFEAVDERAVLHHFMAHAQRLRSAIEAAAAAQDISWTFDVTRGLPSVSTLAIGDHDLLVIEAESRPFANTLRLDSRWLHAAFQSHRPVLLLRSDTAAVEEIVGAAYLRPEAALRIVAVAARLAAAGNRPLTLLLTADGRDDAAALALVRGVSPKLVARCRIEHVAPNHPLEGVGTAERLLIVDALDIDALKQLLAKTRADILFLP